MIIVHLQIISSNIVEEQGIGNWELGIGNWELGMTRSLTSAIYLKM
ncbi:MAG: hypothetical protein F6K47_03380 [Symploca sp. SIO2E6]|nr:hypothetical protein [Symploca sp. SIO2E6]